MLCQREETTSKPELNTCISYMYEDIFKSKKEHNSGKMNLWVLCPFEKGLQFDSEQENV